MVGDGADLGWWHEWESRRAESVFADGRSDARRFPVRATAAACLRRGVMLVHLHEDFQDIWLSDIRLYVRMAVVHSLRGWPRQHIDWR